MPDIADKPFTSVLAEDVSYDPQQSPLMNIGHNLARAGDKVIMRNQWRDRAHQMDQALEEWRQRQAILQQRLAAERRSPQPIGWPRYAAPAPGLFGGRSPL
jgi:hypothetical protein